MKNEVSKFSTLRSGRFLITVPSCGLAGQAAYVPSEVRRTMRTWWKGSTQRICARREIFPTRSRRLVSSGRLGRNCYISRLEPGSSLRTRDGAARNS